MAADGSRVELRSRQDVERFLNGRPRAWAEVLAARAALRVFPLLAPVFQKAPARLPLLSASEFVLVLLRGIIMASLAPFVPLHCNGSRKIAGAVSFASAAANAEIARLFGWASSIHNAAEAAREASASASSRSMDRRSRAACNAVVDAAAAASADDQRLADSYNAANATARAAYADAVANSVSSSASIYAEWFHDGLELAGHGKIEFLRALPLWSSADIPNRITTAWLKLSAALRGTEGAFDWNLVWIDWYEAIRDGRAPWGLPRETGEQILVEAMLWPQSEWDKGALHINRRIAELIEAARERLTPSEDELPQQERFAHRFNGLASEPIDLAHPDDATDRLQDGPDRQEDYTDIRSKMEDLAALGTNRLGHLAAVLERLRSLPSAVADTRAQSFWSVANTLRIKLAGHEAAEDRHKASHARPDYEKDERLLEPLVGDGLKDLVQTINAFVLGDPSLMDRDAARPGPQETQIARREADIIAPVVADVSREPDLATRGASCAVADELVKTATTGSSLAERQGAEAGRRSIRNFVAALLRRAYVPIKKAGPGAAAEAAFAWKEMRSGFYKKAGETGILPARIGLWAGAIWLTGQWAVIAEFVARHAAALSAYAASAFPNNPAVVRIIEAIAKVFVP